jgi:hypothetical protein
MQAAFVIGTRPEASLDEAAAQAAVAANQLPDSEYGLRGRIVLGAPGKTPVELADDLEFLVPNLCLKVPALLAAQGQATLTMASWPGSFQLLRDGEDVKLLDAGGAELGRFPQAALKAALRDCATRFTGYVGALAAQDADWAPLHRSLSERLAASA